MEDKKQNKRYKIEYELCQVSTSQSIDAFFNDTVWSPNDFDVISF